MIMTERERQQAHYKEVRERIWGAKPKPKTESEVVKTTVRGAAFKPLRPLWTQKPTQFDSHVTAYWVWVAEHSSPKRAYIKQRAIELGFTFEDIVGEGRTRNVVAARHLIVWEVKMIWPDASWPELGRILGDRDHTTILYSYRKVEAQMRCDL
jgi:hypothetical protein